MANSQPKIPSTQRLLERAHSPTTAAQIHTTKFLHKPLYLLPTTSKDSKAKSSTTTSGAVDARTVRQQRREAAKIEQQNKNKKGKGSKSGRPKPLSAAEKRKLCIYDIPKEERKYELYKGLNQLWCRYIREILGVGNSPIVYVTGAGSAAMLASADYHGSELEVVRSRCVGRVGTKGIVVRDTMFTFVVITKNNEIRTIPKEHTIFRFELPISENIETGHQAQIGTITDDALSAKNGSPTEQAEAGATKQKVLIFELHGEQFKNRAPDRANKKFKRKHEVKKLENFENFLRYGNVAFIAMRAQLYDLGPVSSVESV